MTNGRCSYGSQTRVMVNVATFMTKIEVNVFASPPVKESCWPDDLRLCTELPWRCNENDASLAMAMSCCPDDLRLCSVLFCRWYVMKGSGAV